MKVLFHSFFRPDARTHGGGLQRMMADLLRHLVAAGDEVTVLSPATHGGAPLLPDVIRHVDLQPDDGTPIAAWVRGSDGNVVAAYARGVDIVVSIDGVLPGPVHAPAMLHLSNVWYPSAHQALLSRLWDAVLVQSGYAGAVANALAARAGWPARLAVVEPSLDRTLFRARPDHPTPPSTHRLVAPHRADPAKGHLTAVRALARARAYRDFVLEIPAPAAHPEPDRAAWRHLETIVTEAERLGVSPWVRFHPWLDRDGVPAHLGGAHACLAVGVAPESFGLTVAEAIASGVPVVATPAGNLADVVPDGCGIRYVAFDDVDGIVAAILDPPSAGDVAAGARYLERNSEKRGAAAYRMVLEAAAGRSVVVEPPPRPGPAPWIRRLDDGRAWHDLEARYLTAEEDGLAGDGSLADDDRRRAVLAGLRS